MRAGVKVVLLDGRTMEAAAVVPDFVAWERKYRRKASDLAAGVAVEDLAFLAWSALRRQGEVSADFDQFLNTVAEVEMAETATPKATRRAASKDS